MLPKPDYYRIVRNGTVILHAKTYEEALVLARKHGGEIREGYNFTYDKN